MGSLPLMPSSSLILFIPNFWKQCSTVAGVVCEWVKTIFANGTMDSNLNNILIVLFPKISNSESFTQLCSISLCTVLYKLVIKTIANRFKLIFPKLIAHEQTGFIARRNITDNIVVTQEATQSMRSKNKRKWMAIKIDLKQAYDLWDFIDVSL
ncbi:uncharacterized protein LOC128039611 [Gossypium raimondii]|uniref:uncharacterized protein LOC128039611 n=1 Tax=Gossypium raimondii TaxID=29730 RepID=UPI00227A6748|nr:uncharacterized protein LOC128039611 [Gossypium raimondii]